MRRRAPTQLADIAAQAAAKAHELGLVPRVALLSYSNFGNPMGEDGQRVRDAVALLDQRDVAFEYDGEMSADVALDERLMRQLYPFCRLQRPGKYPGHARTAQRQYRGKAAAAARGRDGGRAAPPRPVAPGADRQYGSDRIRPRQPRRALGARRDPLIASLTDAGRREAIGAAQSDRAPASSSISSRCWRRRLGSEP